MKITKRLVIVVTTVVLALLFSGGVLDEGVLFYSELWNHVLDHYGVPFGQFCITSLYETYLRFTVINVFVFTMKYLPTGLYLYTFLKDVYRSTRESLKRKAMELEDIVLQIAIVKTKQCLRETECEECASQLERAAAQVRAARARVRDLVAADDALRPLIEGFGPSRLANLVDHHTTCDDHHMMELLNYVAHDKNSIAERLNETTDCDPREIISMSEKSEYSSRSDAEVEKNCQIKIIRVTNVYKVAYLKHYIKQKRLRRANRHAELKKKMESIKKLLEDWQNALNLVMKDTFMLEDRERDDMSREAGDYRPRDSDTDTPINEYNPAWDHPGPFKNFYQEPDRSPSQEDFECQEYDNYCRNYEEIDTSVYEELEPKYEGGGRCECAWLPRLLEETNSQLLAVQDRDMADHNDSNEHILAV